MSDPEKDAETKTYLRNSQPERWNDRRRWMTHIPDLSGINLAGARLNYVFYIAETVKTMHLPSFEALVGADLSGANLKNADLSHADLRRVDLSSANLDGANLLGADLAEAKLNDATLRNTNLQWARLVRTSVSGAQFARCYIYGTSVWDLNGEPSVQSDLVITPTSSQELLSPKEPQTMPEITVDNLEVAQFVHLLLRNDKIPVCDRHGWEESRPDPRPIYGCAETQPRRGSRRAPQQGVRANRV